MKKYAQINQQIFKILRSKFGENTAEIIEQKFNYSTLLQPIPGQHEPSNIFGVVIDFPVAYQTESEKWMLNLKIIDPSLNQRATHTIESKDNYKKGKKTGDSLVTNNYAGITFFAA